MDKKRTNELNEAFDCMMNYIDGKLLGEFFYLAPKADWWRVWDSLTLAERTQVEAYIEAGQKVIEERKLDGTPFIRSEECELIRTVEHKPEPQHRGSNRTGAF